MNPTAFLLATLIVVANATTDDGSAVRVPQAVTASLGTNKPGLVSVVATAISAATPNLRGPDSFIAVSDGHGMEHGQEEQLVKEEDQEDILGFGIDTYHLDVYSNYPFTRGTGTECQVNAWFQFEYNIYFDSQSKIDHNTGSTNTNTDKVIGRYGPIEAQQSDGAFQYVELEILCDDALLVDYVVLWKGNTAIKVWGEANKFGWCMSTDPADAARVKKSPYNWHIMGGCDQALRFEKKLGRVFVPTSCDDVGTFDQTYDCCTVSNKCGVGEGDCDNDNGCQVGLKCGQGSGKDDNCVSDFGWGQHDGYDCCYNPDSCANSDFDPAKCIGCGAKAANTNSCCTSSHKCGIGEGDCDNDHGCIDGLKCGQDNCRPDFGWGPLAHDCCYKP